MPDDPTTPASPQAGDPAAPQPQAGDTTPEPQAGDGETISLEAAKKLRSEAAALRARLKKFEDEEKARADAQLSEQERLKKQLAETQSQHDTMQRQYQERIVRYEVQSVAASLGIIDVDAAAKLIDWSELEYDDDGNPKNAKAVLEKLLKDKPYLAGKAPTQQQQGNPRIPPMNPGRSQITPPTRGQPGRLPRLTDPGIFVPPGTAYWQQ